MTVVIPGFPLCDANGRVNGGLDDIVVHAGRILVSGWTRGIEVALVAADAVPVSVKPSLPRPDADGAGFQLSAILAPSPMLLSVRMSDGREVIYQLPRPSIARLRHAQLRLLPGFGCRVVKATPDALRWLRRRDQSSRSRIKTILGLDAAPQASPLDGRVFTPARAGAAPSGVTVIIPVFNAFDLLPEVLGRVERNTSIPMRLVVIEDCSSDPRVRPFLREWAAGRRFVHLVENDRNLGFIASVNRGFAQIAKADDPVVLLNSDAFVPEGWAERLLRPLAEDAAVATVTPMSNDAEIFSAPAICRRVPLRAGEGDKIDAIARDLIDAPVVEAPTGVGFCMAISPAFLRRLPEFDTAFGRGYGEEVDWCQKIRALGGKHVGLPGLFVEHRGGESFGEAKLKLVQANNAIITARYPDYDLQVQRFIRDDPMLTPRLALAIAFAAARAGASGVPIHVAHSLGGGADIYLGRRIEDEVASIGASIVLRLGGQQRWRIEVYTEAGVVMGTTDSFDLVQRLFRPLQARKISYGCGVGDPDPFEIPEMMSGLKQSDADRIELLFHDFLPLSPSYTLLDAGGRYRGPVRPQSLVANDPAHIAVRPDGTRVSLAQWQAEWQRVADRIVVFSQDSRDKVAAAWPQSAERIHVCPHELPFVPARIPRTGDGAGVIGVLGNIGAQKGAGVLVSLARLIAQDPSRRLVLIGNIDPRFDLPPSVAVHGDYRPGDIAALVAHYRIDCWFIPSIWPETFSFTTHEVLATGMPVYCFDIGAQAEAAASAPNGHLIRFDPDADMAQAALDALP